MNFNGFSSDVFSFYEELHENNTRDFWQEHKSFYESEISKPLIELAALLSPEFGSVKVFRPYRDLRFTKDKRPYQEFASLAVEQTPQGGALYFQLSADGIYVAGGFWRIESTQLETWREALNNPGFAQEAHSFIDKLMKEGFELNKTNILKSAPKGYSTQHPEIDLLRLKSLTIGRHFKKAAWMHRTECYNKVAESWSSVVIWNNWLDKIVNT